MCPHMPIQAPEPVEIVSEQATSLVPPCQVRGEFSIAQESGRT